jgi:hypothetical protein
MCRFAILVSIQFVSFVAIGLIGVFPGGDAFRANPKEHIHDATKAFVDGLHLFFTIASLGLFIITTAASIIVFNLRLDRISKSSPLAIMTIVFLVLSFLCTLTFIVISVIRKCKGPCYVPVKKKAKGKASETLIHACNISEWLFELLAFLCALLALVMNSFLNNLYLPCLHY